MIKRHLKYLENVIKRPLKYLENVISSYSISTVFEAKLMESGSWRSAVDTENLPVNLLVELAQVRKKSTFFI